MKCTPSAKERGKNIKVEKESLISHLLKQLQTLINIPSTIFLVWWQDTTLIVYLSYFIAYLHSFNHIQTIHLFVTIRHLLIACKLSGKNLPALPRIERRSVFEQDDALPTEPRRTINTTTRKRNDS
jgi:hypothetical protein